MRVVVVFLALAILAGCAQTGEVDHGGPPSDPLYFAIYVSSTKTPSPDISLRLHTFATGEQLWTTELKGLRTPYWPPQFENGRILVVGRGLGVESLDLKTGRVQWRFAAPTLQDWTRLKGGIFLATMDEIICLDAATGQPQWKVQGGAPHGSFRHSDDKLFLISKDGRLKALDASSGNVLWSLEEHVTPAHLTAGAGLVMAGGPEGNIYGLGDRTGEKKWKIEGLTEKSIPTLRDGLFFVADYTRSLKFIEPESGRAKWTFEGGGWIEGSTKHHIFVSNLKGLLSCIELGSGRILWSLSSGMNKVHPADEAFAFSLRHDFSGSALVGIDPLKGADLWSMPLGSWHKIHPQLIGDSIYVCIQEKKGAPSILTCLDRQTGTTRWSTKVDGEFGRVEPVRKCLILTMQDGVIGIEAATGRTLWKVGSDNGAEARLMAVHPQ